MTAAKNKAAYYRFIAFNVSNHRFVNVLSKYDSDFMLVISIYQLAALNSERLPAEYRPCCRD